MNSVPMFLILSAILVIFVAAETDMKDLRQRIEESMKTPEVKKCMESTGFNPMESEPHEVTPEKMCFLKCVMEEKGIINADGEVDSDKIDETPTVQPLSDERKTKIKECANNAGKVETCEDVQKLFRCLP